MSSTGCEQLGWELVGGAAERVTRSVSGTKASHSANNGNACCVARSRSSRRLLLPATFTPSTSRQFNNAPPCPITQPAILRYHYQLRLHPSHIVPLIWLAWCGQFVCTIVLPLITDIIYNIHHHVPTRTRACAKASMSHKTCIAQYANLLLACGTLHTSAKSDEVMVASMRVRGPIWCHRAYHISLVPFCTLSRGGRGG